MAITAWSAKVWSSAICLSVKEPTSLADGDDRADRAALSQHRHGQESAEARLNEAVMLVLRVLGDVDLHDTARQNRAAHSAPSAWRAREHAKNGVHVRRPA